MRASPIALTCFVAAVLNCPFASSRVLLNHPRQVGSASRAISSSNGNGNGNTQITSTSAAPIETQGASTFDTIQPSTTFSTDLVSSASASASVGSSIQTGAAASASASTSPKSQLPVSYHELTLTRGKINPNGDTREAILVNGQTPGPLIELEEGQEVSIKVNNYLGEPSTVHWHGIYQYETVWADGVPGVTQYPIEDGASFTYNFTARQYGQYWYHSHYHSQLSDGLRGPLLIHPAKDRVKPFAAIADQDWEVQQLEKAERNPNIVQLSDWSQFSADEIDEIYYKSGIDPLCLDSYLINGRGQRICPRIDLLQPLAAPPAGNLTDKACPLPDSALSMGTPRNFSAQFPDQVPQALYQGCYNSSTPLTVVEVVQSEGWASMNIINIGGLAEQQFSIDGHPMVVYAADGQYVEPQQVDILLVSVGARYSVMVKLDNPGDWTIRTANSQTNQFIGGYAVLSYVSSQGDCTATKENLPGLCGEKTFTSPPSDQPKLAFSGQALGGATTLNPYTLAPFPPAPPIVAADHTLLWDMSQPNDRVWKLDDKPFLAWRDDQTPAIIDEQPFLDAGVAVAIKNGTVLDVVINVPAGQPTHPFHKHETKFWVIGQGNGPFTWPDVDTASKAVPNSFNFHNPSLRDTFRSLPSFTGPTWVVIRYQVLYPSLTFFHCHISYHLRAGMAVLLVEGLDAGELKVPEQITRGSRSTISQNPMPVYPDGSRVDV